MDFLEEYIKLVKDIDKDLVLEMRSKIVPVLKYDKSTGRGKTFADITKVHPSDVAYTWIEDESDNEKKGLKFIDIPGVLSNNAPAPIIMFSEWGYYGFFKPSLEEVFAAIYDAMGKEWQRVGWFWLDTDKVTKENIIGEYHFCKCWLWGKGDFFPDKKD